MLGMTVYLNVTVTNAQLFVQSLHGGHSESDVCI